MDQRHDDWTADSALCHERGVSILLTSAFRVVPQAPPSQPISNLRTANSDLTYQHTPLQSHCLNVWRADTAPSTNDCNSSHTSDTVRLPTFSPPLDMKLVDHAAARNKPSRDCAVLSPQSQPHDPQFSPYIIQDSMRKKRTNLACTSCRGKKMKCTGDRPSCARCLKQGLECIYVVANIERTGHNTKKRRQENRSEYLIDGRQHQPPAHPTSPSSPRLHVTPARFSVRNFPAHQIHHDVANVDTRPLPIGTRVSLAHHIGYVFDQLHPSSPSNTQTQPPFNSYHNSGEPSPLAYCQPRASFRTLSFEEPGGIPPCDQPSSHEHRVNRQPWSDVHYSYDQPLVDTHRRGAHRGVNCFDYPYEPSQYMSGFAQSA
ncbi:hypothetical protein BKA62DRAFT_683911 [Auriculariales sp. MPI-PUGE-AT-0066]|nr:hypothetical protein BKA62DRAFT_683911 [Auriculariales sp. MPI-PUGE-AT-0066]